MELEVFDNPHPERDYLIRHSAGEFTSVCPKTGHPDFATVELCYIPDAACIELKAYKLYLQSYRNKGIFYEAATNRILDDLVAACQPRFMRLETRWTARGGIHSRITAEYVRPGYAPSPSLPKD